MTTTAERTAVDRRDAAPAARADTSSTTTSDTDVTAIVGGSVTGTGTGRDGGLVDGPPTAAAVVFSVDALGQPCWALYLDDDPDPYEYAHHLDDPDQVDDAQTWACQILDEDYDLAVTAWQTGHLEPADDEPADEPDNDEPARPAWLAVFTPAAAAEPVQAAVDGSNATPATGSAVR